MTGTPLKGSRPNSAKGSEKGSEKGKGKKNEMVVSEEMKNPYSLANVLAKKKQQEEPEPDELTPEEIGITIILCSNIHFSLH